MEVLINELSLHKQFSSIEDFITTSLPEFVRTFTFLYDIENYPLKNYSFYSSYITQVDTFRSLITMRSAVGISDYVRKVKTTLDKIQTNPFWEENQVHDSDKFYFWEKEVVTDSSIAESFERGACLLSFVPSIYDLTSLVVEREDEQKRQITNFIQLKSIVKHFYESRFICFQQFCRYYYKDSKLSFQYTNVAKSFDLISDRNDETQFLKSFDLFCEMSWPEINSQGGRGPQKVGLAYSIHHDQSQFSEYDLDCNVDKFRCSSKFRVFGYRKADKFYVLEFDLTHKLSE